MRINHTIDIFIENKKWLNKKVFTTQKSINKAIYNFSYCALKNGILLSKFNQDKKIKKFESKINFILADDKLLQKLNTKFLNNFTPKIKQLLGFGKENNYPLYPKTNLNRLPINGKILSLVSKWFIYRLMRNVFRTEPRRIAKFLKKFI